MAYFQPERNSLRTPRSADMQPDAQPTNRRINRHKTAAPNLLHRHCGEALHLLHKHEAGLVFLILDQLAVADDLAQLGDH